MSAADNGLSDPDFQKLGADLATTAHQNLKFEREDWTLFRTVEGLQQKAGVPKPLLVRLVLKEIADNGLDNCAKVRVGRLEDGSYFVDDDGSGIDPDEVASLFSIARPLVSTKLLRLPTRGALGNGLRVVAGAVLASQGKLTLMVEDYERPAWTFNKLVYIEKEGFSEALKDVRWGERHDCALMSSKGFTTRAARDLVDKLAEHDEPVTIFCVHDADAYGTLIYQTFQEATKARGARKIEIVNLGLEPWEALAMGLEVENVEAGERRKPVADYVLERDDEAWDEWLQSNRVELNAMTTPQFIEWLDGKLAAYDKLVPPPNVLVAELDARIESKVRAAVTERILREAGFETQVATAIAAIEKPDAAALANDIKKLFKREADREWRDHIEEVAKNRTSA